MTAGNKPQRWQRRTATVDSCWRSTGLGQQWIPGPWTCDERRRLVGQQANTSSTIAALHWAMRPTTVLRQLTHERPRTIWLDWASGPTHYLTCWWATGPATTQLYWHSILLPWILASTTDYTIGMLWYCSLNRNLWRGLHSSTAETIL